MQSIENFLCYGKRLTARRLGLGEVHDRPPALPPTPFGLASAERYARAPRRLRRPTLTSWNQNSGSTR